MNGKAEALTEQVSFSLRGLPKDSVVNISQVVTVNKSDLVEKIGALSRQRIDQIIDGIRLLSEPRDV